MEAVRVVETSVVVPSEATPGRRLWVSSLDVDTVAKGYVPMIYLYGRRPADAASIHGVGRLKAALADALVAFYPLAGRLAADGSGRPEIDCNSEGAIFVVARSDVLTADDVRGFPPSAELSRLFVPAVDSEEHRGAMLAVQVTFLKCGGVVVGTAMHHIVGDAPSGMHFMRTWSSIARGVDLHDIATNLPCHDRTLLRARSPPVMDAGILSVFTPKIPLGMEARPVVCKVFHISTDEVADLKRLCGGGRKTSTFRAVAAHVWRCACAARGLAPESRARINFPASVRRHVRPRLPERYFGNTAVMLTAWAAASDVVSGTLASVSDTIGSSVDRLDYDLAQSAIDYLELEAGGGAADDEPAKKDSLPETELKVVSWLGMPAHDADFGWGKPEFMRGADAPTPGFVLLVNGNPANGGGVLVSAHLEPTSIKVFGKLLSTPPAC